MTSIYEEMQKKQEEALNTWQEIEKMASNLEARVEDADNRAMSTDQQLMAQLLIKMAQAINPNHQAEDAKKIFNDIFGSFGQ